MPLTSRPARAIAAACFVVVTWLSAAPSPAAALEPPRPLPAYRPAFVTETDQRPWKDCLWASGAMLLDKWTNGEITRTHQELRSLARDHTGGSTLADLHAAYARLGIDLSFSPDGGERITWSTLLGRLAKGAGAVLLGDDSRLPRRYGRWDYGFWKLTKKEKSDDDNHAVYIERYDRKYGGRVWLMDPLARPGWKGEWITVRALRRFAWNHGGALTVAVTPTAKAAPFAGVTVSDPVISSSATTLTAAFGISAPRTWSFPGVDVRTSINPADDPLLAASTSLPVATVESAAPAPPSPVAAVHGASLRATSALPVTPGAYLATITLSDRRLGRVVAEAGSVAVFVPGPRQASISVYVRSEKVDAGTPVALKIAVANTGTESWAEPAHSAGADATQLPARDTHVVAHWIRLGDPTGAGRQAPVELRSVPLAPGRLTTIQTQLVAPDAPGTWALVVDVRDDVDGSFAALGSAPGVQVFEVVDGPRVAEVQ